MTLPSDVENKANQFIKMQQNVMLAKQEALRAEVILRECRIARESAATALRQADGLQLEKEQATYLAVGSRVLKIPRHGPVRLLRICT